MSQPMPPPPSYNAAVNYGQGDRGGVPPPQGGQPQGMYGNPSYGVQAAPTSGYSYGQPDPFKNEPSGDAMFDDRTFSNKVIRRGFIKRVYLILFTQLLVTFGVTMLFSLHKPIQDFVQSSPGGVAFYYTSYATFLVTYFTLVCCPSVRRKHPGNMICLGVFTLAFTYMVATISSFYTTQSVMVAAGITTAVCLAISLFAIQTKIDFTMCAGLLFALCMVLMFFGFSCLIVFYTSGYNRINFFLVTLVSKAFCYSCVKILDCVWGGLAALVFSLFLVYDTQMIVGGRKHELDPEEYVYGALQLYIDVVYLFLIILSFFGGKNN